MGGLRRFTGRALLADGEVRASTLTFDGDRLAKVGPAVAGEPVMDGLLVPGLINAHTHLELSHVGLVPGGDGLPAWIRGQFARRAVADPVDAEREARISAQALVLSGTSAVSDIAGGDSTARILLEAGLSGVVQRERLGMDRSRTREGIEEAPGLHRLHEQGASRVVERPAAHAPYSTHPDLAAAVLAQSEVTLPVPGSVHLAEDPAERLFLQHGRGPFADLLDGIGVRWAFAGAVDGPVDWLRRIGALGPQTLAVHGVDLTPAERQTLADEGTALVLCVRSNLHIGGHAPALVDLLGRGVRLALGTDGLVSCPDQDVLGELPALARCAPEVPAERWLDLATRGGADALGLSGLGAFRPGAVPGLIQLDTDLAGLLRRAPQRRWLVSPGAPSLSAENLGGV